MSWNVSAYCGGTTSQGDASGDQYVLVNHGVETPVSRAKWLALQRMEFWCWRVGRLASVLSMVLMVAIDRFARRQKWTTDIDQETVPLPTTKLATQSIDPRDR